MFLFIISYTKLYFQELFLNSLKCSLHLVLNVLLGWPTYFVEQSGNFFWYTPFFDFLFACFRKIILKTVSVLKAMCRCQWPCGLRCGSAAACLLRLRVRIPPVAWMFVVIVVCCQVERPLRRTHPSSRGVLPIVVCLSVSLSVIRCNSNPLHLQWVGRKRSD